MWVKATCHTAGAAEEAVRQHAAHEGAETVVLCANLEAGLLEWPADKAAAYGPRPAFTSRG